jgi:hypothetical protein
MDAPTLTLESTQDAPGAFHAAHGCGGLHWAQIMARDVKRKLMVMPSNNSSAIVHYWAGRYDAQLQAANLGQTLKLNGRDCL